MAGRRFDVDKLSNRLLPYGFQLNLPEVMKGGISFVRPSLAERLYEHVLVRSGKIAYAEAVISGATFTSCHACVSERDGRFRSFLSNGSEFQTSRLETWAAAQTWQNSLVENVDDACKLMAAEKGPMLLRRLHPVFKLVDSYIQAIGDMRAILDREFAFVSEVSTDERTEVDRIADLAHRMLYLKSEDARLASLALVRFGTEVEGVPSPFRNEAPHRDDGLRARMILLADFVRAKRVEYELDGGLPR